MLLSLVSMTLMLAPSVCSLLFIHITSGPNHQSLREAARGTWLSECKASSQCEYRFFIDYALKEEGSSRGELDQRLEAEGKRHDDLVLRDACPYMLERHPLHVNYSNAHVYNEKEVQEGGEVLHDYRLRRMYKIDWKMCFLKWVKAHADSTNTQMPSFHAFVEDDSIVCVGNLLHQLTAVRAASPSPTFRTGFKLFDGFDDSSTIMSGDVASYFADHYLVDSEALNCSHIIDSTDPAVQQSSVWLSWGNSWRRNLCNWRDVIRQDSGGVLDITTPHMDCLQALRLDLQPSSSSSAAAAIFNEDGESGSNGHGNGIGNGSSSSTDVLTFLVRDAGPAPSGGSLLRDTPLSVRKASRKQHHLQDKMSNGNSSASAGVQHQQEQQQEESGSGLSFSENRDRLFHMNSNPLLDLPLRFPCHTHRPLVWHDYKAGHLLLRHSAQESARTSSYRHEKVEHMCESMLLVDKVKEPAQMNRLWMHARQHQQYPDLSPAFLFEDARGWMQVLEAFEKTQQQQQQRHRHRHRHRH
jgi:hypothetical protein